MLPTTVLKESKEIDSQIYTELIEIYNSIESSTILATLDKNSQIIEANENFLRLTRFANQELVDNQYSFSNYALKFHLIVLKAMEEN